MDTIISFCSEYGDDFRDRWRLIYNTDMPRMLEVRLKCADLFLEEEWKNFEQLLKDNISSSSIKAYSIDVFNKIVENISRSAMNETSLMGLMDDVLLNDVRAEYRSDPLNFCAKLAQCLDQERDLIDKYMNYKKMEQEVDLSITLMDTVREVETSKKSIDDGIASLEELIRTEDECRQRLEGKHDQMMRFSKVQSMNGTAQAVKEEIEKRKKQLAAVKKSIRDTKSKVQDQLEFVISKTSEALEVLKEKIEIYRKQLQMHYVDLESKPTLPIEAENGFSALGKVLHDFLTYNIEKLQAICDSFIPEEMVTRVKEKFQDLLQNSFIVTEQVRHVIKVELGSKKKNKEGGSESSGQKFKCPTFRATVRLLAGKLIENKSNVKAQFCHEDEVNRKFRTKKWDSPCEFKLKTRVDEAPFDKKKDSASFTRMELERFERKQDKQVCEDKFRIIFSAKVKIHEKEFDLVTISLPIVVTTGASQGCNVHGSLLWQCYSSADIFSVPIEPVVSLTWGTMFQMLDMKYKTLGGRSLRDDEKCYLGKRLVQDEVLTDETEVSFRKFCVDKMMDIKENDEKKKSATFWMWFLAVFNLIKNHLKEYWNENLIYGFVSREKAEQKLGELTGEQFKPYTYMLRFSEKIITDGQGQNLCGAISAACIYKTPKGGIKFAHTIPFKAETFKKKTLAQCVRNTMGKNSDMPPVPLLRWIYPKDKSTEEAFQSFFTQNHGSVNTGYDEWEEVMITKINDLNLGPEDANSPRPIKTAKRHRVSKSTHSSKSKSRRAPQNESDVEMLPIDSSPLPCLPGSLSPYDGQAMSIPSTVHDFDSDSQTSFSESVASSCLNDIPSVASNASSDSSFVGCGQFAPNPGFNFPQIESDLQQLAPQNSFPQQQSVPEAFPTLTKLLHEKPIIKEDFSVNSFGQEQDCYMIDDNGIVFQPSSSSLPIPTLNAGVTVNPPQQSDSSRNIMAQMEQFRQLQGKLAPESVEPSQNTTCAVPQFDLASHGLTISNSFPLKTESDFSCANSEITDSSIILDISQNEHFENEFFPVEQTKEEVIENYEEVVTDSVVPPDPQEYINDMLARRDSDPKRVEFIQIFQNVLTRLGNFQTDHFPDTPVSNISPENAVNNGSDFNRDSNSSSGGM